MRTIDHTDSRGLMRRMELPDDAEDEELEIGILIGPPDLSSLDLPPELEQRLNAELWNRGLLTYAQVMKHPNELIAVWQAALRVDAMKLMSVFAGENGYH